MAPASISKHVLLMSAKTIFCFLLTLTLTADLAAAAVAADICLLAAGCQL
jgi:hypothetical protein